MLISALLFLLVEWKSGRNLKYFKNRGIWVGNILDIWVYDLSGIRYVAIECNKMFYMLHFYKFSD